MSAESEVRLETAFFDDDGRLPNSRLPVIVYRGAIAPTAADPASSFERRFAENGWTGSWRWSVYPFHHYHSTSHEVLGVATGRATLRLGGRHGRDFEVEAGDVLLLPAGAGHKRVAASHDFLVVGAYPEGRARDLIKPYATSATIHDAALARIAAVPRPRLDPVRGRDGPLARLWNG
ncbi:MAG: cupin domain-containing protein [Hyphomicrobiales bacterium]